MTKEYRRWLYPAIVFVAGLLGFAIIYKVPWFKTHPGFEYMVLHIATGLVVAALVGWGYELQTREKEIADLIQQLVDMRRREAVSIYRDVIGELFDLKHKRYGDLHEHLTTHLVQLIDSVIGLEATNAAANRVSVGFVARLLFYASSSAHALNVGPKDVRTIELPASAAALTDEILADQMRAMKKSDTYLVISDFASWYPPTRLSEFWTASESAMTRGVRIRRVFCRYSGDGVLTSTEAESVLRAHWDKAKELGVTGKKPRYDVAVCLRTTAGHPHLGIFKTEKQAISFAPVEGTDLAKMSFSKKDESPLFDRCWHDSISAFHVSGGLLKFLEFDELKARIANERPEWWSGFAGRDIDR